MEVLAIRQLRILLDLLEEDAEILPYISTLSGEEKCAVMFILVHLKNGVENDHC